MNRYEEENGPFCSTDLRPLRSQTPTDEWVRPAPLVENDPSIFEEIAISIALGVVIVATIAGFIIPL
jgi:hypothetical protein